MERSSCTLERSSLVPQGNLGDLLREAVEAHTGSPEEMAYIAGEISIDGLLQRLVDISDGRKMPQGWVPQTTYWLLKDNAAIGVSHLRHSLTPLLTKRGGHIDYFVRGSERGKGYGTEILRQTLTQANGFGLKKVLLTVASSNQASVAVIERNGGHLENELFDEATGEPYRRYWIDLAKGGRQCI